MLKMRNDLQTRITIAFLARPSFNSFLWRSLYPTWPGIHSAQLFGHVIMHALKHLSLAHLWAWTKRMTISYTWDAWTWESLHRAFANPWVLDLRRSLILRHTDTVWWTKFCTMWNSKTTGFQGVAIISTGDVFCPSTVPTLKNGSMIYASHSNSRQEMFAKTN